MTTERKAMAEELEQLAASCEVYSPDQCATLIDGIGFIAMRHKLRRAAEMLSALESAGQGEAQAELTEQQKADRDAVMYGTGFMLGGKHIPADQVTVFSAERIEITPQQPEAQAGGAVSAEDRFEQFVQQAIAKSPEPLRELGEYLSSVLDEDEWPKADRLLLQLATNYTTPPAKVPEGMLEIGELIRSQDNRITEAPIFIVQQKAGRNRWEFVTACFTEQGCKDYIAKDGHNLREPRIFASGSYRNDEWRAIRGYLASLAAAPEPGEG